MDEKSGSSELPIRDLSRAATFSAGNTSVEASAKIPPRRLSYKQYEGQELSMSTDPTYEILKGKGYKNSFATRIKSALMGRPGEAYKKYYHKNAEGQWVSVVSNHPTEIGDKERASLEAYIAQVPSDIRPVVSDNIIARYLYTRLEINHEVLNIARFQRGDPNKTDVEFARDNPDLTDLFIEAATAVESEGGGAEYYRKPEDLRETPESRAYSNHRTAVMRGVVDALPSLSSIR